MTSNQRKYYYLFPHVGFPKIFFENGERFYKDFTGANAKAEVNRFWTTLAKEFNVNVQNDLDCYTTKLQDHRELITIKMPDPKEPQEVKYIGLVYIVNRTIFKTEIVPYRYFTLELAEPVINNKYFVCEWNNKESHKNYGVLGNPTQKYFGNAIQSILVSGKVNEELLIRKEVNHIDKSQLTVGELQEMLFPKEDFDKVRPILERWSDKIPKELYDDGMMLANPIFLEWKGLNLYLKVIANLPQEKISAIAIDIEETMHGLVEKAIIIGVEYGFLGLCNSNISDLSEIPKDASNYLMIAGRQAAFISSFIGDEVMKFDPSKKFNTEGSYKAIMETQFMCFKLGVNYGLSLNPQKQNNQITDDQNNNVSDTYKQLADVAISDPDPAVRQQAQAGLRELFPGGEKAFDDFLFRMIEMLRDPQNRNLSMMTLTAYGEMVFPQLKMYLKDPDPEMRRLATQIIIEIEKNIPQ